jgi:hypothetical protein
MTSARQLSANRANARRSTGPKSTAGKVRSAANARQHGLRAELEAGTVRAWYRLILDDPRAMPDPLEQDAYRRAARDLAEAEAQLSRVRLAEERHLLNPEGSRSLADQELTETPDLTLDAADYVGWERAALRFINRMSKMRQREALRQHRSHARLLARYRATAEARRHKALGRWIEEITKRTQS